MSKLSSEEEAVKVGIYARVSTDAQEARGTIGSQLDTLRARVAAEGDELVGEFIDDGYSGARLDRPGLDALRDAAEAGIIDIVWCLSPDRLARSAYQILILEELARFDVLVESQPGVPQPGESLPLTERRSLLRSRALHPQPSRSQQDLCRSVRQ
jgi:site-specific DNA recombinase